MGLLVTLTDPYDQTKHMDGLSQSIHRLRVLGGSPARRISLFSSPSASTENRIIAEYVKIPGGSLESVRGVGISFAGVLSTDSVAAKRSRDSSCTKSGCWDDSSDGRMKSPGSTEDESAPPITCPSLSIAAFCHMRGLTSLSLFALAKCQQVCAL
jgi:hypothetical protein